MMKRVEKREIIFMKFDMKILRMNKCRYQRLKQYISIIGSHDVDEMYCFEREISNNGLNLNLSFMNNKIVKEST